MKWWTFRPEVNLKKIYKKDQHKLMCKSEFTKSTCSSPKSILRILFVLQPLVLYYTHPSMFIICVFVKVITIYWTAPCVFLGLSSSSWISSIWEFRGTEQTVFFSHLSWDNVYTHLTTKLLHVNFSVVKVKFLSVLTWRISERLSFS